MQSSRQQLFPNGSIVHFSPPQRDPELFQSITKYILRVYEEPGTMLDTGPVNEKYSD